ncbi:hypothetical protein PBY51_023122 [Eleginops maclovinus]|uniref:Uncharacterized protein n=1 Tax=Eleginops maclovinus TaxID=56733 RepID=A0AAN8A8I0_ELEMC|nr:hypothetical protein PBY51_023122 [Eleginops maclovinus]
MVHGNDPVLQHFQTDKLTQQAHTNPGNQSPDAPSHRLGLSGSGSLLHQWEERRGGVSVFWTDRLLHD